MKSNFGGNDRTRQYGPTIVFHFVNECLLLIIDRYFWAKLAVNQTTI